ncbi:MAG TPA: serine/threonine-protein kinase [Ktedonobacteraceae bacterium]|nr:serine/threonine-protein kinase [Ktedonobacteraceae bacterium]
MANHVGRQLGNYRLMHLLGVGGFAEVYLGQHIYLGTSAAIKLMHAELTSEYVELFRTEAFNLAHLIHPHIVRLLDFGLENNMPYLIMDYAPHGTLRKQYSRGMKLPLSTIVPYVKQIAEALQYAHDQRLVHRDVKPENMLLGRDNQLLLSDFGIAVVAHSTHSLRTQDSIGTVSYMAPEQLQKKPRPASDQYALGVVVYEWLTGGLPFTGAPIEVAMQHLIEPVPNLRDKIATLSKEVEQVVLRALEKDPQSRFESVQEFARSLEQASLQKANQSTINLPEPPVVDPAIIANQSQVRYRLTDTPKINPKVIADQSPSVSKPTSATAKTKEQWLREGRRHQNITKKYEEAFAAYNNALKLDTHYAEAYNKLGSLFSDLKDYPQAIGYYNHALALEPQFIEVYQKRGDIYFALKDYGRAKKDYSRVISLDIDNASSYYKRGNAYFELGKYIKAINDYDQAIALDPQFAWAYYNRGNMYRKLGMYKNAVDDYEAALALYPNFAQASFNLEEAIRLLNTSPWVDTEMDDD